MTVKILIGYTLPDQDYGYHPMLDGYRPGAAQDTLELDIGHLGRVPGRCAWLRIVARGAEALYVATNAPPRVLDDPRPAARLVRAALDAQPAVRAAIRPVSVGDTVTVAGRRLACAHRGWVEVADPVDSDRKDPG